MTLIVFEGGDKCGKSTQCNLLYKKLLENETIKERVKLAKYPGKPNVLIVIQDRSNVTGHLVNKYLKGEIELNPIAASLLLAANLWESKDNLTMTTTNDDIVIMDRYFYSNIAYSAARGFPMSQSKVIMRGLPEANLVFYLVSNNSNDNGKDNNGKGERKMIKERGGIDQERFENPDFQHQVCKMFDELKEKEKNWYEIDCDRTIDEMHEKIKCIIQENIKI